MAELLHVDSLRTVFHKVEGAYPAVDDVSLTIGRGEVVGLVGESGSGKSVTGFSLMGLVDSPGEIVGGAVRFENQDLLSLSPEQMRRVRGNRMAMIFQDPLMTLNPVLTIGEQMFEAITEHEKCSASVVRQRARDALAEVGIPSPEQRLKQYPHEFSGGMRQRVAIAIAMINRPALIIADEPTTALDVTIQSQILSQMQRLISDHGTALLWITHDLGVVAEIADRIAVMYAGRIIEIGTAQAIFDNPQHPYTIGLLESLPALNAPGGRLKQISGVAPALDRRPEGCAFRLRCSKASETCTQTPPWTEDDGHGWSCFHPARLKVCPL